jgi:ABC-type polysaccharide/polyol phosphate transport system ATPase subunit
MQLVALVVDRPLAQAQQEQQILAAVVAVTMVTVLQVLLVDQVLSLLDTQFRKRKTNGALRFFRR